MSTRPSSTDEKATTVGDSTKQGGILSPKKAASTDDSEKTIDKADNGSEVAPVSVFQLFRFSTRLELFLDAIGLVAAAAAGAAQVCCIIVRVFLLKLIFPDSPRWL